MSSWWDRVLQQQPMALGVDEETVLLFPPGLSQESIGLSQEFAVSPGAVRNGLHVRRTEDLVWHLSAQLLEQFQLGGRGQAGRLEIRTLK